MLENSLKKFSYINYVIIFFILVALLLLARNIIRVSFAVKDTAPPFSIDTSVNLIKKDIMKYASILEKNPFGRPMELYPIALKKEQKKAPSSFSDLLLVGTAVGPDRLSYAIFEDKSRPGKQEVVAYNAKVFNYGVLTKITSTSVTIEQDASSYTLTFPKGKAKTKTSGQSKSRSASTKGSFAKKVGEKEYVLDRRRVQKSLENPEQILTDARLLPNFVDGRQEGFKISEVVRDGLYHSMGLKNGDILLRVNGLEISNPEVAMQAMTALKGMNNVNLDIKRKGRNMSMSYQMR
jgi:general secretion pathway protein C